jgi:hypothetical protein
VTADADVAAGVDTVAAWAVPAVPNINAPVITTDPAPAISLDLIRFDTSSPLDYLKHLVVAFNTCTPEVTGKVENKHLG